MFDALTYNQEQIAKNRWLAQFWAGAAIELIDGGGLTGERTSACGGWLRAHLLAIKEDRATRDDYYAVRSCLVEAIQASRTFRDANSLYTLVLHANTSVDAWGTMESHQRRVAEVTAGAVA